MQRATASDTASPSQFIGVSIPYVFLKKGKKLPLKLTYQWSFQSDCLALCFPNCIVDPILPFYVLFLLSLEKLFLSFSLYFSNFAITKSLVLWRKVFTRNLSLVLKLFNSYFNGFFDSPGHAKQTHDKCVCSDVGVWIIISENKNAIRFLPLRYYKILLDR